MFRVSVMDDLNRLYLDDKRNDAAQKIMLEAREQRKKHNLGESNFLAGATQAASGQRVVEREIQEREVLDESNPGYWMERAAYYRGRNEAQEEEKALRKVMDFFDTPETRIKLRRPDYRDAYNTLHSFFVRQMRFEDAAALFREHRALVRDEPQALRSVYDVEFGRNGIFSRNRDSNAYRDFLIEKGYYDKHVQMLVEDMKAAWDWLFDNPKMDSKEPGYSDFVNNIYSPQHSLAYYLVSTPEFLPELVIREKLVDFVNDPRVWKYMHQMDDFYIDRFIGTLLFRSLDAEVIEMLEQALKEDKLSPQIYYYVGDVLLRSNYPARALPFLEASAAVKPPVRYSRYQVLSALADCTVRLNDWRKGEEYSVESFLIGGYDESKLVEQLLRAADLAEKASEKAEAERIRKRVGNLGAR
jgi:tetratricopeptide (TPR) repeat protein